MVIFKLFLELFTSEAFLVTAFAWLISQLSKATVNLIKTKKFVISQLFSSGGMPSGHSATVMSLTAICAVVYGFDSAGFVVAFMLALIVMHDALGVRYETDKQNDMLKKLAEKHNATVTDEKDKIDTSKLKPAVGHTKPQVFVGAALGVLIVVFYCLVLRDTCAEWGVAIREWMATL